MRSLHSRAGRFFLLVIATTVACSAGTAAASVVQTNQVGGHARAASQPITFHKLALINGWQSSQPDYGSGDPSYAISGGVIYLSGSLKTSGSNPEFAVLPVAARPGRNLDVVTYTFAGTFGSVLISKNGAMSVEDGFSDARLFLSLAAIAYPTAATRWHNLKLINNWRAVNLSFGLGKPGYAIKNGVVYLSGALHRNSGSKQRFAVLPPAARPAHLLERTIYTFAGSPGELQIFPGGQMSVSHGDAPEIAALGAVAFATSTVTTHSLALLNGWRAGPPSLNAGKPSYAVRGGVVYLSGALRQSSGTKTLFAVLPAGARPKHNLYLAVFTAGGVVGELHITVTGHAELFGIAARTLTSLTGISYPRTS